jgi:hypothetical protein
MYRLKQKHPQTMDLYKVTEKEKQTERDMERD